MFHFSGQVAVATVVAIVVVFLLYRLLSRKSIAGLEADSTQLYIGNLSYRASEAELTDFFVGCGPVSEVRIVKDRRSGRSKGYAFVRMASDRSIKLALKLNGTEFMGRRLVVHVARPKEKSTD